MRTTRTTKIEVKNKSFLKVIFATAILSIILSLLVPALAIVPLWTLIGTLNLNIILAVILELIGLSIAFSVGGGVASFLSFIPVIIYAATQFADEDSKLGENLKKTLKEIRSF
jgi:hypothetical protein